MIDQFQNHPCQTVQASSTSLGHSLQYMHEMREIEQSAPWGSRTLISDYGHGQHQTPLGVNSEGMFAGLDPALTGTLKVNQTGYFTDFKKKPFYYKRWILKRYWDKMLQARDQWGVSYWESLKRGYEELTNETGYQNSATKPWDFFGGGED